MPRPAVNQRNFWNRVDQSGGPQACWPWRGHLNDGRGRVDINGLQGVYCSRIAYFFEHPEEITLSAQEGRYVLHKCDNPTCCNPAHLYVGDRAQNQRDKVERGRSKIWKHSTMTPRAKLSADDVRWIRDSGTSIKWLAARYHVSLSTIKGVLSGRHYRDVT